ncbi:fibronectin type III domain-containing protein [Candidatus Peregrinibacteria bacterium]|nr:fibronectin type III domain-containing protein [Candidatus Peregrinibacteria bacterium]
MSLNIFALSPLTASVLQSPPPTPSITGPTLGVVGGSYRFSITMSRNNSSPNPCRLDLVFDNGTGSYGSRGPYAVPVGGTATTEFDTNWLRPGTYSVRAQVQDVCLGNSSWSPSIAVTITPDTTPPTAPTFFYGGAQSTSQIDLTFGNSTDNAYIAGYKVYRNDSFLANASGRTSDFDFHSWGTYSDTGLSPSTTYTYTFAAYDSAGNISSKSDPVSLTTYSPPDTAAPSNPTNLSATAISSSQIDLSWNASTDNVGVIGYKVYRNGDYFTDVTSPSFSDTYVSANTTYGYTVAAYDIAGNLSSQSSSVSATTLAGTNSTPPAEPPPDTQAPTAPTELTVTDVLSTQINLTWTAPTDNVGVVGYKIFRNGEFIDTTVNTYYNDHNQSSPEYYTVLPSSTTYVYTVAAYDEAQNLSLQSNSVSAKTLNSDETIHPSPDTNPDTNVTNTPPPVPSTLTSVSNSGTVGTAYTFSSKLSPDLDGNQVKAIFDWGDGETSENSSGLITPVAAGTSVSASHSWSTGGTYKVKVKAVDSIDESSAWSSSATMTIKVANDDEKIAPSIPTNLSAKVISSSQINLTWNASTDNTKIAGYKILRGGVSIGSSNTPSYSDTGLSPATSYSYTVAAYDVAGNISAQSSPVSAKTSNAEVSKDKNTDQVINDKDKDKVSKNTDQTSQDKDKISKDTNQVNKDKMLPLKFTRNLRVGSKGDDVKALQQILINEGVFPKGKVTGSFDIKTKIAVIKFQNKYTSEILTPMGLKKGNGIVAEKTRAKLNALYKGSTGVITPPSTTPTISSLSPSSGPVGSKFTITGSGFTPTGNKVKFGDLGRENSPDSNISSDGTTITFTVPGGNYLACWNTRPACQAPAYMTQPGTYDVSVINTNGTSRTKTFTVTK